MKIKRSFIFLCLTLVFGLFSLCACGNAEEPEPEVPKHTVTAQSTEECTVSVDKTQAEFAETVTVTVNLKSTDKYIEKVTYNGQEAAKRSDNTYDFLMGNDDVTVAVELKEYRPLLIAPNGFATYLTGNPTTLAKRNGVVDLTISLNGSYMTILNWDIRSTNQNTLPGSSIKNSYTELAETGAITASVQTGRYDNLINALILHIDTDKLESGKTFLLIDLENGNSSSQKASLVVPLTVAEDIVTTKWSEHLLFNLSALPEQVREGRFNIYVTDLDFVSGSDNKKEQDFKEMTADDGKIAIDIEYVPSHRYYVAIWAISDDGTLVCYRLAETIGSGSSTTGYNQFKNETLTLISDGQSITLVVENEVIH